MKFKKLGRVYAPSLETRNIGTWRKSHAYMPTPIVLSDRIRLFITCKGDDNIWRVTYIDLCKKNPKEILYIHNKPVLSEGAPGTFDEHGAAATSIVKGDEGLWYLYYFGWQLLAGELPRSLFAGFATSKDLEVFKKETATPVMDRWHKERFLRSSPFVRYNDHAYECYYSTSNQLDKLNGHTVPRYHIAVNESACGWKFDNDGVRTILRPKNGEQGLARPWIVKHPDGQREYMFYSIRDRKTGHYRIGYAMSRDGYSWKRIDKVEGLDASTDKIEHDYKNISYGAVVQSLDKWFLFYNGYNYGGRGVGVAELEKW
jgi:hypothetical protein